MQIMILTAFLPLRQMRRMKDLTAWTVNMIVIVLVNNLALEELNEYGFSNIAGDSCNAVRKSVIETPI
jgi:hypothetical protein